jgi:GT2 family glycosyltransferase
VTGAFISVDRPWFEHLGGFNEEYVLGHYEDADLCLTSLQAGVPAWLHDLRFWHLEGKGSTHERAHEGAALVNRWLFTARWREALDGGLLGPHPAHPLLQDAPA